jgi:membrane protein implicated in regulation of membrane protease activity
MTYFLTEGAQWFTGVAVVATLLFTLTVLLLFMGGDSGGDLSGDLDLPDGGDPGSNTFKVLSFQGIVGFGMGWGFGGLAAFRSLDLPWPTAAAFGAATGLCFVWMLWLGFKALHDLTGSGNVRPADAIGLDGTVTVEVPPTGSGRVRVVIGRRQREFRATTSGEEIPSRAAIRVISANDDGSLQVTLR